MFQILNSISITATFTIICLANECYGKDCSFINLIDTSFLDGGITTSCSGQSCLVQGGTSALLSSCSPLLLKSASNPTGTTLTPDPLNTNSGKIHLSCSTDGTLTATGFTGGADVTGVMSVEQTKACCLVSDMALYSTTVTVTLSPQTPIDDRVYEAKISNCYKVERVVHMKSVQEVCEGIHRLKDTTNNITVECVGSPGQAGTWAIFPGCIPLSGPGGNAVSAYVHGKDRTGGGIIPPTPIHGITSVQACIEECMKFETGGRLQGQFGCVAFAYVNGSAPYLKNTCWIKEIVPNEGRPLFSSLIPYIWSGVFKGTIKCNDDTILPCNKWCDGVSDCPAGEDELGCPEPCNTVHRATNNACGSTLVGGSLPVEGGKYFQCSPGQCVPCSNVCDKQLWGSGAIEHCPSPNVGLDEADSVCEI